MACTGRVFDQFAFTVTSVYPQTMTLSLNACDLLLRDSHSGWLCFRLCSLLEPSILMIKVLRKWSLTMTSAPYRSSGSGPATAVSAGGVHLLSRWLSLSAVGEPDYRGARLCSLRAICGAGFSVLPGPLVRGHVQWLVCRPGTDCPSPEACHVLKKLGPHTACVEGHGPVSSGVPRCRPDDWVDWQMCSNRESDLPP